MTLPLTLRLPTVHDEAAFWRAHEATSPAHPSFLHHYTEGMSFEAYRDTLAAHEPAFLFAFVGDTIVGRVSLRAELSEWHAQYGGHIGYIVVPEYRRRGYATEILRQALLVARDRLKLSRVLVTCDDDNVGSIGTIEKNGGVFERVVSGPEVDTPKRRYWFDMTTGIRFTDGAGYERYMGRWSQLAGRAFIEWLNAPPGWRWLDVGCGNGAFTEMLIERCAPSTVHGIDPSEAQIAYAQTRTTTRMAEFQQGNAMALPFADAAFDAAVMPLVIAFVPDPAKGVAEMVRVVRSGGIVAAYMWDQAGGGFPYHALMMEMRARGVDIPSPPSPQTSELAVLAQLWRDAGLDEVTTQTIEVKRTFANFDDYWATVRLGPSVGPPLAAMSADALAQLEAQMRAQLPVDANGQITYRARAHAVKGRAR
ncbi:MAG: GNAT family N-acetyltransferase [Acidobacteria bacterium]|nr:GNAT family N-acetyltransferase [Acidobacteriota bacterium]